jgi:hypothetical protein
VVDLMTLMPNVSELRSFRSFGKRLAYVMRLSRAWGVPPIARVFGINKLGAYIHNV